MAETAVEKTKNPIETQFGDKTKLLEDLLKNFQTAESFLRPFFTRWLRYYKLYRNYVPNKSRAWRANIVVPIAFADIEHGSATLMDAWFANRPPIQVYPREGTDYEAAKITEGYLDWEMDSIPAFLPIYDSNKGMLQYGTSWMKVFWDWNELRNSLEDVSAWNLYPDGSAENVDDAEFLIHRALRSPSHLKRMARLGVYDISSEEIDKIAKEGLGFSQGSDALLSEVGLGAGEPYKNRIEVLEQWSEDPKTVVTVLNRKTVVRARPNKFPHGLKPFILWKDHHVPHELMGIGEIEVNEKLIEAINDAESQKFDVVSQAINNVTAYNRQAGIDPDEVIMRPGQLIGVNGPPASHIVPLIQNTSGVALASTEIERLRFYSQMGTGNWAYTQGQQPERRETATTVLALQRAAGLRFTAKVRWNEESAMKRMASMMISNAAVLGPPQKWIRITGQKLPQQFEKKALIGKWDFVPAASSAEPKEAKRARLGEVLPLLLRHPRLDEAKFLKVVLDIYSLAKESEQFILNDDQYAAKLAQMLAAKQGMPVQPGKGGNGIMQESSPESVEDIAGDGQGQEVSPELVKEFLQGAQQ